MDYGTQIARGHPLDRLGRAKSRLMTGMQYRIMRGFERLTLLPPADRIVARAARRLLGAHLYSIKIEVNNACQLHCRMCYVEKGGAELPLPVIRSLLDQVRGCGVRIEILGGEPLQRADIAEIVRYAKREARVPFVSLYTNGIPATNDTGRQLREAGLDAAIVTLVSHREEVHDRFTGVAGSWDRTMEGIRCLRDHGVPTYTFTAVHSENVDHLRAIHDFVTGPLGVHALFYQYVPQRAADPLAVTREAWHEVKRWVLMEKNEKHMRFVRTFFLLTGNACSGGNFVLTVKVDGTVQPCPFVTDIPLGSVRSEDIWTIYRRRYRGTKLREFKSVPGECAPCTYHSVCGGGCKAGNSLLHGDYCHADHRCLGPYSEEFRLDRVPQCVPTFF